VPARRRFNGGGLCLPAEGSLSAPTTEPLVGKKVVVAEVAGDSARIKRKKLALACSPKV